MPPEPCDRILVSYGEPAKAFRVSSLVSPVRAAEGALRVVVYAGYEMEPEKTREFLSDFQGPRDIVFEVVDGTGFADLASFQEDLRQRTPQADLIVFQAHANPFASAMVEVGDAVLTADALDRLDWTGKTVFFAGCRVGHCLLRPEPFLFNPSQTQRNPRVAPEQRLLEAVIRKTGAQQALGYVRKIVPDQYKAELSLLLKAETFHSWGLKAVRAASSDEPQEGDTKESLISLRGSKEAHTQIHYLKQNLAWWMHGLTGDEAFFSTVEGWLSDPQTDEQVVLEILEFVFHFEQIRQLLSFPVAPNHRTTVWRRLQETRRLEVPLSIHALVTFAQHDRARLEQIASEMSRVSALKFLLNRRFFAHPYKEDLDLLEQLLWGKMATNKPGIGELIKFLDVLRSHPMPRHFDSLGDRARGYLRGQIPPYWIPPALRRKTERERETLLHLLETFAR